MPLVTSGQHETHGTMSLATWQGQLQSVGGGLSAVRRILSQNFSKSKPIPREDQSAVPLAGSSAISS
jgi:hypothetical protein